MALEICVDNLESAIIAAQSGADRLEVCADLSVGGLTPSKELIQDIKEFTSVPLFVMIRPSPGDFIYNVKETSNMLNSIKEMQDIGVQGLVFGALDKEKKVDREVCKTLLDAASGLPVTFHRAFDYTENKMEALEDVINLGFLRILTSGGPNTAEEGVQVLHDLILKAGSRITVLPGGGINENNIALIQDATGAQEIHSSGRRYNGEGNILPKVCSAKNIKRMKNAVEAYVNKKKSIREQELRRKMLKIAAM